MRIFGGDKLDAMLQKLGIEDGESITHPWVNKALEKAQKRVEAHNYDIRKHLLKFDDVMNDQRKVIYGQRSNLMQDNKDFREDIDDMRYEVVHDIIYNNVPENTPTEFWDHKLLNEELASCFGTDITLPTEVNLSRDDAVESIFQKVIEKSKKKEEMYHSDMMRYMERTVLLRFIDQYWKEHLLHLDKLRQGINLRAYGQRDPLNEYKQEAFLLFEMMSDSIRKETVKILSLFELPQSAREDDIDAALLSDQHEIGEIPDNSDMSDFSHDPFDSSYSKQKSSSSGFKISRNSLCPCGSGEKYKHCCGKVE
jgi:preprotein translocase subunit SecA